jgi:hypothetical protein
MTHLLMGRNDDVVIMASELGGLGAEGLANRPLHAVAFDRGAPGLESNAQAEVAELVRNPKDNALGETKDLVASEEFLELP